MLPKDVKNIYISNLDNKTIRYDLGQILTNSLKKEFIQRTKLKLLEDNQGAELFLEGTITSFLIKPVSYSADGMANVYNVTITLNVRLSDLRNSDIIYENNKLTYSDNFNNDTEESYTMENIALDKISKEAAESIVSAILENY